jgi:hypothetical protein
MFLLFSKQNKSRCQLLGLFVVSVSILKGVIVKSELLVSLYLLIPDRVQQFELLINATPTPKTLIIVAKGRPSCRAATR